MTIQFLMNVSDYGVLSIGNRFISPNGTRGTYGGVEGFVQVLGGDTRRREITCKT